MNFDEYQGKARATAIYPEKYKVIYPVLGLAGESGEVCEKIKKIIRDNGGIFTDTEFVKLIEKELGDVLWYVANVAFDLGLSLEEIAKKNIDKLQSRKERDVLKGSGDER